MYSVPLVDFLSSFTSYKLFIMNKKNFLSICMLALAFVSAMAQGPNNSKTYYQAANGKSGQALKTALYNIIKTTSSTVVGYDNLKAAYTKTDVRSDGYLRDWYSISTHYTPGSNFGTYSAEGDAYNREHLVPQSWFGEVEPMKSDIMHVIPTDGYVNNRRSNYPLAEVGTATYISNNGYCKLGRCKTSGYTGTVFEPNDEIKGDIARIYFYMATCYEDKISSWANNAQASYVFDGNTYPGFNDWYLAMLMRWSKEDPIDDIEIARNNTIASDEVQRQNNRNPFVDYPGLEEYIWGDKKTENFSYDNYNNSTTIVYAPAFSPEPGTYTTAQNVTITSATTGATIYYAFGNDSFEEYNGEVIPITATTTLKAYAVKDGEQSSTVIATYIIDENAVIPSNTFAKVTSASQIAVGNEYILVNEENKMAAGPLSGKYLTNIDVEVYNNVVTLDDNSTVSVITLGGSSNGYSLKIGNQYLTTTTSKSLSLSGTESNMWSITSTNNGYVVDGGSLGIIYYNKNSPRFLNYTSTGQEPAVLYVRSNIDLRKDPNLSYSQTTFQTEEEQDFEAPTLVNPYNLTGITYSSSDEEVAAVDENTGAVAIGKPGTATVTASFPGNADYKEGTASYTITVTEKPDPSIPIASNVTFNFPEKSYGMTILSGSSQQYNPNPTTISEGSVSLTMSGNNSSRYWQKSDNDYELRVYKTCNMTISVPTNASITKIVFDGDRATSIKYEGTILTNKTWEGEAQSVSFTFGETQRINTIDVTIEVQGSTERKLGDVNGDGYVNITDAVVLSNYILGNTPEVFYEDAADVNSDNDINITDVTALINLILNE